MKKWCLLMIGTLLIAGTVQAHCGSCEGEKKAADKAACALTAGAEAPAALKEAACEKKTTAEKAVCPKRLAKEKAEACVKAAPCAKEAAGKKWYNPVSWFK